MHDCWAHTDAWLKQHITVHAAYVDALCACAQTQEALQALEQMLELYAAQHGPEASQVANSQSPASEETLGASGVATQGASPRQENSSRASDRGPQSHELKEAASGFIPEDQRGFRNQAGARNSFAAPSEPAHVAHRAAQAACHQVLDAAAKARLASMSRHILQAMHQVTYPVICSVHHPSEFAGLHKASGLCLWDL